MRFENREALINFEKEREEYYRRWLEIRKRDLFKFYKMMFLETFHTRYRSIKEKYENYDGGWYMNDNGVIFTNYLYSIDEKDLKEGDLCCELGDDCDENNIDRIYAYHNGILMKI